MICSLYDALLFCSMKHVTNAIKVKHVVFMCVVACSYIGQDFQKRGEKKRKEKKNGLPAQQF